MPSGSLLKHAPEDLSRAIGNWDELTTAFRAYPCLNAMLLDTSRRIFDDCGDGMGFVSGETGGVASKAIDPTARCACSWRTPIVDTQGNVLDDASAKLLDRTLGPPAEKTGGDAQLAPQPTTVHAGASGRSGRGATEERSARHGDHVDDVSRHSLDWPRVVLLLSPWLLGAQLAAAALGRWSVGREKGFPEADGSAVWQSSGLQIKV